MPRGQTFRRDTLETYKLVIQYMECNKVPFNTAIKDLRAPMSTMFQVRSRFVTADYPKNLTPESINEFRRMTEWAENYFPTTAVEAKAREEKPAPTKTSPSKKALPQAAERVVCIVGTAEEVARALAGVWGQ